MSPFNGNPVDWQMFIGSFYESTKECGFSARENILRLRKCLKREALDVIREFLVSANVGKVVSILERRFGLPKYIIDELTRLVTEMSSVKGDKPMTMIKFADAASNLVATVESLQSSGLSDLHILKQL